MKIWPLFQKKSNAAETEAILLENSEAWLSRHHKRLVEDQHLQEEAEAYSRQLLEKKQLIENLLEEWKQNKNLTASQYDEFHFLFEQAEEIFEGINFSPQVSLEKALKVHSFLKEKLEELQSALEENSFSEDFNLFLSENQDAGSSAGLSPVRLNPLQKELFELRDIQKSFEQKMNQSKIIIVQNLFLKLTQLKETDKEWNYLQRQLLLKKERLEQAKERKKEKEEELRQLKEDSSYSSLSSLVKKRETLLLQIEDASDVVFVFFSKIKRGLEEYARFLAESENIDDKENIDGKEGRDKGGRELVLSYLEDYSAAFFRDKDLEILSFLQHLKTILMEGKLPLTPAQRNMALKHLEKALSGYLLQLQLSYYSLKNELKEMEQALDGKSLFMKIKDAQYRQAHFQQQAERLQEEVILLEDEVAEKEAQRNSEKDLFEKMVKDCFGKAVILQF